MILGGGGSLRAAGVGIRQPRFSGYIEEYPSQKQEQGITAKNTISGRHLCRPGVHFDGDRQSLLRATSSLHSLQQTIAAKEDWNQKRDPGSTIPNSVANERGYQTNGAEKCHQKRDAEYLPDGFPSNATTGADHEVSTGSFDAACVAASILSTLEPD